jgi:hypothetical protein
MTLTRHANATSRYVVHLLESQRPSAASLPRVLSGSDAARRPDILEVGALRVPCFDAVGAPQKMAAGQPAAVYGLRQTEDCAPRTNHNK